MRSQPPRLTPRTRWEPYENPGEKARGECSDLWECAEEDVARSDARKKELISIASDDKGGEGEGRKAENREGEEGKGKGP